MVSLQWTWALKWQNIRIFNKFRFFWAQKNVWFVRCSKRRLVCSVHVCLELERPCITKINLISQRMLRCSFFRKLNVRAWTRLFTNDLLFATRVSHQFSTENVLKKPSIILTIVVISKIISAWNCDFEKSNWCASHWFNQNKWDWRFQSIKPNKRAHTHAHRIEILNKIPTHLLSITEWTI